MPEAAGLPKSLERKWNWKEGTTLHQFEESPIMLMIRF
jgi:hypothetical protein